MESLGVSSASGTEKQQEATVERNCVYRVQVNSYLAGPLKAKESIRSGQMCNVTHRQKTLLTILESLCCCCVRSNLISLTLYSAVVHKYYTSSERYLKKLQKILFFFNRSFCFKKHSCYYIFMYDERASRFQGDKATNTRKKVVV